jgi:hypothetical protein
MWYKEQLGGTVLSMVSADNRPKVLPDENAGSFGTDDPYRKLGFNSPKPVMAVAATGTNVLQNFIALPGGTQTVMDLSKNGAEGATLIFIEPGNGSVLKSFTGESLTEPAWRRGNGAANVGSPYMGMMVSEPFLLSSKQLGMSYSSYLAGRVFASDNQGNIFSVYLEDKNNEGFMAPLSVANWKIRTIATLQEKSADVAAISPNYAMPLGLSAAHSGEDVWIAGGTSNVSTLKHDAKAISGQFEDGWLLNKSQMIFAFRTNEAQQWIASRGTDWESLAASDPDSKASPATKGWYIPLQISSADYREYVTTKPLIVNGSLYVATFTQSLFDNYTPGMCGGSEREVSGTARLYIVDLMTGEANYWTDAQGNRSKYLKIDGIKITGMTRARIGGRDTIIFSFDNLSESFNPETWGQGIRGIAGGTKSFEIDVPSTPDPPTAPGTTIVDYWLPK